MTTSLRPLVRISWRDVARNRARSALVVALVAVPVAAAVGGITVFRTTDPTPDERATSRMGQAALLAQAVDDSATTADLEARLPPGSRVDRVVTSSVTVSADGGVMGATGQQVDLDGLAEGMLDLRTGRLPVGAGEVAASAPVLDRAGVRIGDDLVVDGAAVTVVGEVRDPERLSSRVVVTPPDPDAPDGPGATWLIVPPAGARLDRVAAAVGGDGAYAVQTRADGERRGGGESAALVLLGGLGLVEAALVSSAAFAVSTRRRQRELGLLAATGGDPRHLRKVVLLSGLLLGAVGSMAGAAVGLAVVRVLSSRLQAWSDRAIDGIVIPPLATVGMMALGVAAAAAAAWVPARAASRLPVLTALAGRRPPASPSHRSLTRGVVLIAVGVAIVLAAAPAARVVDGSADIVPLLLLAGSVASVLGFGMTSPWLLEQVGRLAPRLAVGGRLAVRDTARFRTRNGPAVTAVLAGLALSIGLGTGLASLEADDAASYTPVVADDQLLVQGPMAATVAEGVATELAADAAAPVNEPLPGGGDPSRSLRMGAAGGEDGSSGSSGVLVGDGELVRALGGDAAAVAAFDDGRAVWFGDPDDAPELLTAYLGDLTGERDLGIEIPVHVVPVEQRVLLPEVAVSVATLGALGVEVTPGPADSWVVRLREAVTDAQAETAEALAAGTADTTVLRAEGYRSATTILGRIVFAFAVVTGLVVLAVALALAAAKTRSDQRALLAVGADPNLRRSIAAGRAAVLGGLGGVLSVPAGLLPVVGLLRAASGIPLVVPWGSIAMVGIGTPVLAVVGAWLLTRPAPSWTASRSAA